LFADHVPDVAQRPSESRVSPARVLDGHSDEQPRDLGRFPRPSRSASLAAVVLLGHELSVPPKDGIGAGDAGDFAQRLATEGLTQASQPSPLRVRQANAGPEPASSFRYEIVRSWWRAIHVAIQAATNWSGSGSAVILAMGAEYPSQPATSSLEKATQVREPSKEVVANVSVQDAVVGDRRAEHVLAEGEAAGIAQGPRAGARVQRRLRARSGDRDASASSKPPPMSARSPRFVVHDRDSIYCGTFRRRVRGLGTRLLVTPPR